MAWADLLASIAVFLPAVGFTLWLLGRYDGYFEHPRLFFAMGAGLFAALLVRFLEVQLFPFERPAALQPTYHPVTEPFTTGTLVASFFYTAVGYALIESFARTAILGVRKFRSRKDTPYYGAALGLAFGAMWGTSFLREAIITEEGRLVLNAPVLVVDGSALVVAVGLMLSGAAAGVWTGKEIGTGKLWLGTLIGLGWAAPGLAFFWMWRNRPSFLLWALCTLVWGVFAIINADRRVLARIVPPEIRDMVRKERRRERRKGPDQEPAETLRP